MVDRTLKSSSATTITTTPGHNQELMLPSLSTSFLVRKERVAGIWFFSNLLHNLNYERLCE